MIRHRARVLERVAELAPPANPAVEHGDLVVVDLGDAFAGGPDEVDAPPQRAQARNDADRFATRVGADEFDRLRGR